MATFRERVTAKGERKWQAIVRREGFPDKVATFPAKRDAERWARLIEGEYAKGKHLPSLEAERHTLADLLDRHGKELTEKRRKAVAAHLKWWRDAIGTKKLSELTPALLREQLDRLATEPYSRSVQRKAVTLTRRRKAKNAKTYTRSPSSVNRYKETLSKALTVAVNEYEWMPENPLAKIPDRKEPQGRVRYLTAEERAALLEALGRTYLHASGHQLPILSTCIDSGYATEEVYDFVLAHQARRIYATKGFAHRSGEPIVGKPSEKKYGRHARPVRLYPINVDDGKADVMNSLTLAAPGPGYLHVPVHVDTVDEEFFAQLCAEHRETRYNRAGVATHTVWVKDRDRNEALDTAVLALAACRLLNPNIRQMTDALAALPLAPPPSGAPDAPPPAGPPGRRVVRSRYAR